LLANLIVPSAALSGFFYAVNYTYSKSIDDTFCIKRRCSLVQNSLCIAYERGPQRPITLGMSVLRSLAATKSRLNIFLVDRKDMVPFLEGHPMAALSILLKPVNERVGNSVARPRN
jgi:hypothetical protein